jgi:hypothetical protein
MKSKITLSMMLLFMVTSVFAQTESLSGFRSISKRNINTIQDGSEVKGYSIFYKVDKADKKNDNYAMNVYDENLTRVKTLEFKKQRNVTFLLGNAFNGDAMALMFYNTKEKAYELESYDNSLKKLATKKVPNTSKSEKMSIQQNIMMQAKGNDPGELVGIGLFGVPGQGFVKAGLTDKSDGYSFTMYDNNMNEKWTLATPKSPKEYEVFFVYDVSEDYIAGAIIRRPGKMSKKFTYYVGVVDVKTGKLVIDAPIETSASEQLSINGISIDKDRNEFIVSGDSYNLSDKPGVNKSKGFYVKKFSPDGKITAQAIYSWNNDVKKVLPAEASESVEKGFLNFTHKMVVDELGKVIIVTEQYRTTADAMGIASNILGGGYGASMTKVQIENIMLFELSPALELTTVKFYDKNKSNVGLQPGMEFYGTGMMGYFVKLMGGFDYQFIQVSNDKKEFNIAFTNWEKEKGEKAKKYIGNIIFNEKGEYTLDKIDVTNKAAAYFIYPAKPGHVMMVDWLRKEKTVGLKLVKLNY